MGFAVFSELSNSPSPQSLPAQRFAQYPLCNLLILHRLCNLVGEGVNRLVQKQMNGLYLNSPLSPGRDSVHVLDWASIANLDSGAEEKLRHCARQGLG